jgi:hypothetical protein
MARRDSRNDPIVASTTTTEITEANTVEAEFDPAKAEAFGGQMMGILGGGLADGCPRLTW